MSEGDEHRTAASLSTGNDGHRLELFEAYRSYVRHEDSLINFRLTWILTIHGFLFATYRFTLQKKIEIISNFVTKGKSQNDPNLAFLPDLKDTFLHIELFLLMIAVVGMAISFLGHSSIKMANVSLLSLMKIYRENYTALEREEELRFEYKIVKYKIAKHTFLPDITGGGTHADSDITNAPLHIVKVLIFSWFVAIAVAGYFIYKDPQLYGLSFSK